MAITPPRPQSSALPLASGLGSPPSATQDAALQEQISALQDELGQAHQDIAILYERLHEAVKTIGALTAEGDEFEGSPGKLALEKTTAVISEVNEVRAGQGSSPAKASPAKGGALSPPVKVREMANYWDAKAQHTLPNQGGAHSTSHRGPGMQ